MYAAASTERLLHTVSFHDLGPGGESAEGACDRPSLASASFSGVLPPMWRSKLNIDCLVAGEVWFWRTKSATFGGSQMFVATKGCHNMAWKFAHLSGLSAFVAGVFCCCMGLCRHTERRFGKNNFPFKAALSHGTTRVRAGVFEWLS